MISGRRAALEVLADAAQFFDEIMRTRNHLVGLADFGEWSLQFRWYKYPAIISEVSGIVGVLLKIAGWSAGNHGVVGFADEPVAVLFPQDKEAPHRCERMRSDCKHRAGRE